MAPNLVSRISARERHLPGESVIERAAKRVHIGPTIDPGSIARLLRCNEVHCADNHSASTDNAVIANGFALDHGQAEVEDLHVIVRGDHDIGWREIAMDYPHFMGV